MKYERRMGGFEPRHGLRPDDPAVCGSCMNWCGSKFSWGVEHMCMKTGKWREPNDVCNVNEGKVVPDDG